MKLKCLWCLNEELKVEFTKKAHTIPMSLGGMNYNKNVCDECNEYFGNKNERKYSIEEALKETFNITRFRLLHGSKPKKQVGKFKSRFFEIKTRNGKPRLVIKPSFRFQSKFQMELSDYFKRGLYKMFLEELNRQYGKGFESKYNAIRHFARYGQGAGTILYFNRVIGIMMMIGREAETPILMFDRMKYLYSDEKFVEIEFLGHVFGLPVAVFTKEEFEEYIAKSIKKKTGFFKDAVIIKKLTDIDFTLSIMNDKKTA